MKILKFSLFNSILKQQLTLAINTLQHLCLHQSKKNVSTNHLTSPEFLMFRQTTTVVCSPMDKATCSRFKIRKVQPSKRQTTVVLYLSISTDDTSHNILLSSIYL